MSKSVVKTMKDVAEILGVHDSTIRQWIKKGMPREEIRTKNRRDKFRYDIKKIQEWKEVYFATQRRGAEVLAVSDNELDRMKASATKFKGAIDFYKVNRADIFAGKQMSYQKMADFIISSIKPEEISQEKLGNKLAALKVLDTGAAIFYDKERLERGESTQNVSMLIGAIKELKRKRSGESIPKTS